MRTRGQRAGLTREAVIDAALAVLRRDGLAALSMRHLAAELGVAPNAIYSHVPDKSALIDALLDAVLAGVESPARGSWRAQVEAVLGDSRRMLLAHPDLVPHFLARQTTGPNALRLGEIVLHQLSRGGITGERGVQAFQVLLIHTIGSAAFEVPRRGDPDPAARAARGRTAAEALDPETFPHTTEQAGAIASPPGDRAFAAGLRWLLDGLEADR